MHEYYKIATNVSIDFDGIAFDVKVLGNALATLFSTIVNSGFSTGMDETDGFAMVLLGVLTMLVVGVFGVLA